MKKLAPILGLIVLFLVPPAAWADDSTTEKATILINKAVNDIEASKYDEAVAKLEEANKLKPNSPLILNMIGAALTKKHDFDKAKGYFEQALAIDSGFFPARFNQGEIIFLKKSYPNALDYFSHLLQEYPDSPLLQFKVTLCLVMTDQVDEAKRFVSHMKFFGDDPAQYFSKAAIAMAENKRAEAIKYIQAAGLLYGDKVSIYEKTFEDLGWPVK